MVSGASGYWEPRKHWFVPNNGGDCQCEQETQEGIVNEIEKLSLYYWLEKCLKLLMAGMSEPHSIRALQRQSSSCSVSSSPFTHR